MGVPPVACWLHRSVQVRPSSVAGRGLFTTAELPAGTVVSRLGGRLVSTAELTRVMASAVGYVDSIVVDEDRHLLLAPGSDNRFGNHGCDPNLGWIDEYTLATMVDVPAGHELLSDYAMSTAHPDYVLRCHCESYRCRQMVAGDDWRIPQLQVRYRGWWVPYVQRLVDGVSASPSAKVARPAVPGRPPSSRPGP